MPIIKIKILMDMDIKEVTITDEQYLMIKDNIALLKEIMSI